MSKGLQRSIERARKQTRDIVTERFSVAAPIDVDGAVGIGDGQLAIGGLPKGQVLLLGAYCSLVFRGAGGQAGLSDTWAGNFSIGTTADADDTLATTDANVVASTALTAATAEVSPETEGSNVVAAIIDNSSGASGLFINLLVDDVDISADDINMAVEGVVGLSYVVLAEE